MNAPDASPVWTHDLRARLDELLDEHRAMLRDSLDGLTESEARRSLVPSRTTLPGLVKHGHHRVRSGGVLRRLR